ncbi:MAG: 2Fe-2S iron-sulfur cluster-binding protein [Elainellaceae cyanobacterium]
MADKTHSIEIRHQGKSYKFQVGEDEVILEAALSQGLELPYSCSAGVCTTCAGKVIEGQVNQEDAAGIGSELKDNGYVLLCSAYPRSDLIIESEQEDIVYQIQFGQP